MEIQSHGPQWWEMAYNVLVSPTHSQNQPVPLQSVSASSLLIKSNRRVVGHNGFQFLRDNGLHPMIHEAVYSTLYELSQKEESNRTNEVQVSNIRDILHSLQVRARECQPLQKKPSCLLNQLRVKRSAPGVFLPDGSIARDRERTAAEFRRHWDLVTTDTGDVVWLPLE